MSLPRVSSMPRIVIDDAVAFAEILFGELGECRLLPGREIDASAVRDADALIVRSRTRVDAALLKGSRVSFVGSTVAGLDHVDRIWLNRAGIHFYSAQGCNSRAVAEYVIASLLSWAHERNVSLRDKTLAIVGVGNVGRQVQRLAEALGMRCLLNDPPRARREADFPNQPLNDCLRQADFVTLHLPLTREGPWPTYRLLDEARLAQCDRAQIIINAARGGVIDERAWRNHPGDKIIDCWENEPCLDVRLFRQAWLATPHIAGHSLDAKLQGALWTANALRRHWGLAPLPETLPQTLLPAPAAIAPPPTRSMQTAAHFACRQAWDFRQDQRALMDERGRYDHKRFEYYRRHYPPRREWTAFSIAGNASLRSLNLLKKLGFKA